MQAIHDFPKTTTRRKLWEYLRLINFYRRFNTNSAELLLPLKNLLSGKPSPKAPITWSMDAESACLFLDIAKYYLKCIWIENAIISDSDFAIQQSVDSIIAPPGIDRIPCKIHSGFYSFTADLISEKNWGNYFSLLSLQGRLLGNNLGTWNTVKNFHQNTLRESSLEKSELRCVS